MPQQAHDALLGTLMRTRDILSATMYRKQGGRYPLQEYQSAGNMGIAETLAAWDTAPKQGTTLAQCAYMRMLGHMKRVRLHEQGLFNNIRPRNHRGVSTEVRYTHESLESYPAYKSLVANTGLAEPHKEGFARVLLCEILLYLRTVISPQDYAQLACACEEYNAREISALFQVPSFKVYSLLEKVHVSARTYSVS